MEITKEKLLTEKTQREANLGNLQANIRAMEANLEQARANTNAMVGAIQQLDMLLADIDVEEKEAAPEAPAAEESKDPE